MDDRIMHAERMPVDTSAHLRRYTLSLISRVEISIPLTDPVASLSLKERRSSPGMGHTLSSAITQMTGAGCSSSAAFSADAQAKS